MISSNTTTTTTLLTLSKSGRLSDLQSVYLYLHIFATRINGNDTSIILDATMYLLYSGTANEYIRCSTATHRYTSLKNSKL